jgi:hypothetical protein
MSEEVFADAIGEITVTGNVVRVDLLTIEGFAHATEAMIQMRQQLLDRGILKLNDDHSEQMQFTESKPTGQPN